MNFIKITVKYVFFHLPLVSWPYLYCQDQSDSSDCAPSSKWIRLREINGEWVIYKYCFAGTASIEFSKQDDGSMMLIVFSEQDSEIYKALETYRDNGRCCLLMKNNYSQSGETREISFRYLDDSDHTTEWDWGGSTEKVRYVLSRFENEVPVLYENNGDCRKP